jgi:hypothetical protein
MSIKFKNRTIKNKYLIKNLTDTTVQTKNVSVKNTQTKKLTKPLTTNLKSKIVPITKLTTIKNKILFYKNTLENKNEELQICRNTLENKNEEFTILKSDYDISEHELNEEKNKNKILNEKILELEKNYNLMLQDAKVITKYVRIKCKDPPNEIYNDDIPQSDDDDENIDIKKVLIAKNNIINNKISDVSKYIPKKKNSRVINKKTKTNMKEIYLIQSYYSIFDDNGDELYLWKLIDKLPECQVEEYNCTDIFNKRNATHNTHTTHKYKSLSSESRLEGKNKTNNEYLWYSDLYLDDKHIQVINIILSQLSYVSIDKVTLIIKQILLL